MKVRRAFSASVFLVSERRVLLIEHKLLKKWLPVGGELWPGESPLEAARREAQEETGLRVDFRPMYNAPDGTPHGFLGYEEHDAGPKGIHMNFCFVGFVHPGETQFVRSDGSYHDWKWVPLNDPNNWPKPIPKNVQDIMFALRRDPSFGIR